MNEQAFGNYLKRYGKKEVVVNSLVTQARAFEEYVRAQHKELATAEAADIEGYVASLGAEAAGLNEKLRAIALYYQFSGHPALASFASSLREQEIAKTRRVFPLREFRGVHPEDIALLEERGIADIEQILTAGRTPERRQRLAEETGIPEERLLELVKLSDLARLGGLKGIRARLFYDAWVDTLDKIAQSEPEALHTMLVEWVARTGFDGIAPLPKEVRNTVAAARRAPKRVKYGTPRSDMAKRFGFRHGVLRDLTIEEAAATLKQLGYDCLELCLERPDVRPETLSEARCRDIADTLADIGIEIASVSYHGDNEPPEPRRENQQRAVQITRWLGASILILNGEKVTDRARQWAEHVERLRLLCRDAEDADIFIAIEPEPLLVIGSSQEMAEMIAEVGSPRLKVNLDIGHAQITDPDLAATIHQLGSAIVHVHLEDIQDRVHKHLPFGAGSIDFRAVRQALEGIGYQGPYVADLFSQSEEPTTVATQALAGMRQLFR